MRYLALCTAAALVTAFPAWGESFGPEALLDGTVVSAWTLENGLRVVVRDIPRSDYVAVSVAVGVGSDHDPKGHEGEAHLLAELYFTGPAGYVPERTREELYSLRPAGWGMQVSPRFTLFTEVGTRAQFPEVLRQAATRLTAVRVTPEGLRNARSAATRELANLYAGNPGDALYYEAREAGLSLEQGARVRLATGKGIVSLGARDLQQRLDAYYSPANTALSIAGNLKGLDVRAMVRSFFASIPRRTAAPTLPSPHLQPGRWTSAEEREAAVGVVGVIAPALEDTLHPAFYFTTLMLGDLATQLWGPAPAPLTSRFQYRLFDDPTLARFFPTTQDPQGNSLAQSLLQLVERANREPLTSEERDRFGQALVWMLGGELQPELRTEIQRDPGALATLANGAAVRELWGGEAFWKLYRRRFLSGPAGAGPALLGWYRDSNHLVVVQHNPAGRAAP